MAYDIKLLKLINGDIVLGKLSQEGDKITDVAMLQTVPTQQGVQMLLLPFGYPFEQEIGGEVSMTHVMYEYKECPEELKNKYFEAVSNLTISSTSDLGNLGMAPGGGAGNLSNLFKK